MDEDFSAHCRAFIGSCAETWLQGFEIDQRLSWKTLATIGDNSSIHRDQNGKASKETIKPRFRKAANSRA